MTWVESSILSRLVERRPLVVALVLSFVIHLGVYGSWQLGKHLGWWQYHPAWLANWTKKLSRPTPPKPKKTDPDQSLPMTFLEVDPDTVTPEPPKDAKYYSSKNSKAANPDPKDKPDVKVDGRQEQVVRVMDNEKPKPFPLQPAPPKPPVEEPPAPPQPKTDTPGDLALVKPANPAAEEKPRERPRRLAEARAQKGLLTGEKMKQDGGVSSRGSVSFDAKATPFGEYDAAFIAAVEQCWHILLDQHQGTQRPGRVVVDFRLTYDGRITDLKVQENNAGEILGMLCQSAIINPAPYPRWPPQMRQTVSGNYRDIRFTFYYN